MYQYNNSSNNNNQVVQQQQSSSSNNKNNNTIPLIQPVIVVWTRQRPKQIIIQVTEDEEISTTGSRDTTDE